MADFEKIKQEFTDLVLLDVKGKTREELLLNIVKFAKNENLISDVQIAYNKFLDREKLGTTAIGNGLALPEACWIEMGRPYAFILCRAEEEVEFNSLDGKPVRIILASFGRDKDDLSRLKPMLNLTKLLKSERFRCDFLKAKDIKEIYDLFLNRGISDECT